MELNPSEELVFSKMAQGHPKQILTLHNTADTALAFKVKTTAPKQFVVRPNAGRIGPGEKVEVIVLLQTREGVAVDVKRKDKFLVQSIKIPGSVLPLELDEAGLAIKMTELWTQAEQVKKSVSDGAGSDLIMEKKLRCSYLMFDNPKESDDSVASILEVPKLADTNRASIYINTEPSAAETSQILAPSSQSLRGMILILQRTYCFCHLCIIFCLPNSCSR